MRFLLDTNFLLIPGRFRIDVFRELEKFGKPELFTLNLVVSELTALSSGGGRDSANARLALTLIEEKHIHVIVSGGSDTDSEIERIASEEDFVVCTQDRELQKRLKREGILVISLRQKGFLERL